MQLEFKSSGLPKVRAQNPADLVEGEREVRRGLEVLVGPDVWIPERRARRPVPRAVVPKPLIRVPNFGDERPGDGREAGGGP